MCNKHCHYLQNMQFLTIRLYEIFTVLTVQNSTYNNILTYPACKWLFTSNIKYTMYTPDILSPNSVCGVEEIFWKWTLDSGDSASYIFVGYVLCRPYSALTISVEELGAMAKNNLRDLGPIWGIKSFNPSFSRFSQPTFIYNLPMFPYITASVILTFLQCSIEFFRHDEVLMELLSRAGN